MFLRKGLTMEKVQKIFDQELLDLLNIANKQGLKIGLALGSGSARGMAHIGVIQVLQQYQIPIHFVAGTSIGAVVGSIYATGVSVEEMEEIICSMKNTNFFSFLNPAIPSSGFISGSRGVDFLERIALRDKKFSDLKIPFAAVATDIKTGTKVILDHGSVIKAVRASFAIPGIFTPVRYQEYFLVDGGLVDPVPVDITRRMGADLVIAVSLSSRNPEPQVLINTQENDRLDQARDLINLKLYKNIKTKYYIVDKIDSLLGQGLNSLGGKYKATKKQWEGPYLFEILSKSIDIMEKEMTSHSIINADIVIKPKQIDGLGTFEFNQAEKMIKEGREATKEMIPQIKETFKMKIK
jgi:NTE family protein